MNNKEQTAVEWFFMTMNICGLLPTEEIVEYYNQAKEMEREKHKQTYHQGLMSNFQNFDEYYNETYGDKK